MEIRKRVAITGCLAAASLALAACGGGSGSSADYSGYVQAPAGSTNDSKVQTPDTKDGNNGGGNNNDGSSGIAEGFERGGSD